MAPEQQGFMSSSQEPVSLSSKAGDVWAVGAMIHLLLTKRHIFGLPFDLYEYISGPEEYLPARLRHIGVSLPASTFIQAIMRIGPQQRLTTEQALDNPWLL
jgi:serine/threonine protein kinase